MRQVISYRLAMMLVIYHSLAKSGEAFGSNPLASIFQKSNQGPSQQMRESRHRGSAWTFMSTSTIYCLRGGSTTALAAARKAGSSAIHTASKHPWLQAVWTWIVSLCHILRRDFNNLNSNQRFMMMGVLVFGVYIGRSLSSLTLSRFTNVADIPTKFFGPSAPYLTGRAVSISDGDTFRFYHTPTPFHQSTLNKKKQRLSDHTLLIRICTIDAPETSKFGKPGQPFGEEAKKELQRLIENQIIQVRLLSKDQYGRAVGQAFVPQRLLVQKRKGVDEILLRAGLAEVYQGMGAVYGPKGKEEYLRLEAEARKAKKGIWSTSKRESAAEYKRRTK